ncbi:PKD domain-containing protein [Bacteroidota bacterium]
MESLPSATDLGNLSTWDKLRGLDVSFAHDSLVAIISSQNNNKFTLLNFGNSILNTPSGGDILDIGVSEPLVNNPIGIRLIQDNGNWYGLFTAYGGNNVIRMNFGSNLFSEPTFDEVMTITTPTEISLNIEGLKFQSYVINSSGQLHQLNFSDDMSTTPSTKNWGNFGLLGNTFTFDLVKSLPSWKAFTINYITKKLYRIDFYDSCSYVNIPYSSEFETTNVKYSQPGNYVIELNAFDEFGNLDTAVDTTEILNNIAPSISFSTDNACINNSNTFTASSSDDPFITAWNWNFGDGNSDSGQSVNHQYGSTGKYLVTLDIESTDGCTNTTSDSVVIYDAPVASFDLPTGNICTNSELVFVNTSNVIDADSAVFTWNFNDEGTSNDIDSHFTFDVSGNKDVLLVAEITGCIDSTTQQLSVTSGPTASFSWTNSCWNKDLNQTDIQFINNSETTDVIYTWNFGDASPVSNVYEPNHIYTSVDTFIVSLSVESTLNGCITNVSDTVIVNDSLLVSFTYDTTVIENIPHQFFSTDLTLNDDSIILWNWSFGALGSSTDQNPLFAFPSPDSIEISLNVLTLQGCDDKFVDTIYVEQAEKPTAEFSAQDSICINEDLLFTNQSVNGISYVWDFCFNEFENATGIQDVIEITEALSPEGIELVYDKGYWYSFVTSRDNSRIYRLDFGTSLDNTPVINDLGNIDGFVNGPKDIRFVYESGSWFGILANMSGANLVRISFGDSLSNTPTGENLGNLSGWNSLRGIDLVNYGDSLVMVVSSSGNDKLTLVNFGLSIQNNPTITNTMDIGVGNTLIDRPMGISLIEDQNNWYGLLTSYDNSKVLFLSFGTNLFSEPTISEIGDLNLATDCSLLKSGDNFYGIISSRNVGMYRLIFDSGLEGALFPLESIPEVTGLSNVFNISSVRNTPSWDIFTIGASDNMVKRSSFEDLCGYITMNNNTYFEPIGINYDSSGTYPVEFTAFSSNGNFDITQQNVVVKNQTAPLISFSNDNACIVNSNTFTASSSNDPSITIWNWNFGDGNSDLGQTVNHQYGGTGEYKVTLIADADNGCQNNTSQLFNIYDPPVANFIVSDTFNCTFNEVQFINKAVYTNPDSLITWNWDFGDGVGTSTELSPLYSYAVGSDYNVTLTASIPGCESDAVQTITIMQGPLAAFTFEEPCDGESVFLTNTTLNPEPRTVDPYFWDFGDGYTLTLESPNHLYDSASIYKVVLTAWSENGCVHLDSSLITVHHIPEAALSWELACHDNETRFYDNSIVTDANITSWTWNYQYADTAQAIDNGSSNDQNPEFTFTTHGTYNVQLEVTSNYGCSDTVSHILDVFETPFIDFTFTENCLYDSMQFTDLSQAGTGSTITSWTWMVEDVVYTSQHPAHKFNSAGTYTIDLVIRADNLCESIDSAEVFIPELPVAAYTSFNDCLNDTIVFTSQSYSLEDSILQYIWDIETDSQSTGSQIKHRFDNPGDYNIKHWVLTERGCLDTIQEVITIHEVPTAKFYYYPLYGAPPLEIEFTNISSGASSYFWWFDYPENNTSSRQDTIFIYKDTGVYQVQLMAINDFGCKDSVTSEINVVAPRLDVALTRVNKLIQNNQIDIVLTITNEGTVLIDDMEILIDINGEVRLTEYLDTVLVAGQIINYRLNFNVVNYPGYEPEYICITLKPEIPGEDEVDLSNNQECITEDDGFYFFNPYPNPTRDRINLAFFLMEPEPVEVYITDLKGEIVLKQSVTETKQGLNVVTLLIDEYKEGMYLVITSGNSFKEVRKINIVK